MENNKALDIAFKAAKGYSFNKVKEYLDAGGGINVCDSKGKSLLTHFIEAYLNEEENYEIEQKESVLECHDEFDYDFWDAHIFDYQTTPLAERKHPIIEELNYLFEYDADPNLCEMRNGYAETPLYITVCGFQDYYLTKYLLEHGADPGVWISDKNESPGADQDYFLIEDLDIAIVNGQKGPAAENSAAIAQLLWKYGLKNWSGLCIEVDSEKGVVDHHPLNVKF